MTYSTCSRLAQANSSVEHQGGPSSTSLLNCQQTTKPVVEGIPGEFTQTQAASIAALHWIHRTEGGGAIEILRTWIPTRCSQVQAACIEQLLDLSYKDFLATLADATEDCDFREVLYLRSAALL